MGIMWKAFVVLTAICLIRVCRATSQGAVRLLDGEHNFEGRVEVFYYDEWGTICDGYWSINEATVVCKQLGFVGADQALVAAAFGAGSGPIWLDDVQCTGEEERIFECDIDPGGTHNCGHQDDASVICTTHGSLRLVNGSTANQGRLEIQNSSEVWGTVCSDSWDDDDGLVACEQLGYTGYLRSWIDSAPYGSGQGQIFLSNVQCKGGESRLENCTTVEWGNNNCTHEQDVSVECDPTVVKLVAGTDASEGRVEVFYGGAWGTVCDDHWGMTDADVVCREMGYDVGALRALKGAYFGPGSGPILLDNVQCTGEESSIFDCDNAGWSNDNCGHFDDASVVCLRPEKQVRLLSGMGSHEGIVELSLDGEWGIICDSGWGDEEATVVCRQLGYSHGSRYKSVIISQFSGNPFVRLYDCTGEESLLTDCSSRSNGIYCHNEDTAQVVCSPPREMDLKLFDGLASDQGRIEVYHNSTWGTISTLFNFEDEARVVCRQLGYEDVTDVYYNAYFGEGTGPIWIDHPICHGDEDRLEDCVVSIVENNGTSKHSQDVGVLCRPYESIGAVEVRLVSVDGSLDSERGRVEVLHDGVWGTVCLDMWSCAESTEREKYG